jgi:hypothetical protein
MAGTNVGDLALPEETAALPTQFCRRHQRVAAGRDQIIVEVASCAGFWCGWIPSSGFPGFRRGIHLASSAIAQGFDNESEIRAATMRWIPGGFPGEKAGR